MATTTHPSAPRLMPLAKMATRAESPATSGPAPSLTVQLDGTTVMISWPACASSWTLESKSNLSDPVWTVVGPANPVVVHVGPGAEFYRLRR